MLIFSLLNLLLLPMIQIVYTSIPFGVNNQSFFFICGTDECVCCHEFNQDQFCSKILNTTRLLNYLINDENEANNTNNFPKSLRQIERPGIVKFRICSNNQIFKTYSIEDYNLEIKLKPSTITINKSGMEKCLMDFCTQIPQNKEYLGANLKCDDNNITDLFSYYVNISCFNKIRYVNIKSTRLTEIGTDSFLFNHVIKWKVVYLTIDFADNILMNIPCDVFRYLNELRTLRLNVYRVPRYKCLFRYNPDLVKIAWKNIRIWNMCNESIEIWTLTGQYHETHFDSMFFNQAHSFKIKQALSDDKPYIMISTIVIIFVLSIYVAILVRLKKK